MRDLEVTQKRWHRYEVAVVADATRVRHIEVFVHGFAALILRHHHQVVDPMVVYVPVQSILDIATGPIHEQVVESCAQPAC